MPDYKEQGLLEIKERVEASKDIIGLKGFRRTPTKPTDSKYLPCVYMHEGIDIIAVNSSRNPFGFPRRRSLEVELEVIVKRDVVDMKSVFKQVRAAVFGDTPALVGGKVTIFELRTEGPTGYGLPDVVGMSLVLGMNYPELSFDLS